MDAARWSIGVIGLIMDGIRPARVADQIIDDLRKRERNGLIELPKRPGPKPGDQVRILQGPFAGQLGLYAGMRAHERVLVLLALLGGQQRVELAKGPLKIATGIATRPRRNHPRGRQPVHQRAPQPVERRAISQPPDAKIGLLQAARSGDAAALASSVPIRNGRRRERWDELTEAGTRRRRPSTGVVSFLVTQW